MSCCSPSLLSLGVHGAGTELSLPPAAAPLRCSRQTQHVSKSLSIFNENFCVYTFLGLGTSVFWSLLLFGFSWDRWWPRVAVSPAEAGLLLELAVALRQDPSTSQSLAAHPGASCASPRRSTGPDLASLLPMDVPRLLLRKETPGNPNRLSQGEKQTALDLESTSTSCQSSLSSLPSNQRGFSSNPTFPT